MTCLTPAYTVREERPFYVVYSLGLIFFFPSLIHFILRYYEDFKIDRKTGEANLTQIYLQVLSILILVSKLQ